MAYRKAGRAAGHWLTHTWAQSCRPPTPLDGAYSNAFTAWTSVSLSVHFSYGVHCSIYTISRINIVDLWYNV